jgi:hypothetical protein
VLKGSFIVLVFLFKFLDGFLLMLFSCSVWIW